MESLRLDGTTIRGTVKGRQINCIVRSVPDGLVLPRGQYLLRVGENNPIYGLFLAVEAAGGPAAASAHKLTGHWGVKDTPAAVATLVPTKPAYSAIIKEVPGAHKIAPVAHKVAAGAHKIAPAAKFDAPAVKFDAPAAKFDAPAVKIEAPAAKFDAPAAKFDAPAIKFDAPAAKFDAAAVKADFVPGQGMTARVIIAVRPIGQNSLVAQAGFSDLVDAVQQAGGVTLIVA
jgi:hypothetical protein